MPHQSSISLSMARQSRKRPLEDDSSLPELLRESRVAKKIKTGQRPRQHHHDLQTSPPSPPRLSQDNHSVEANTTNLLPAKEVKLSHIAIPISQPSPNQNSSRTTPTSPSPPRSGESHPANDSKAIAPSLLDTVIPLTRQALREFNRMSSQPTKESYKSSFRGSRPTNATSFSLESGISTKSGRVTAYSNYFQQILADDGIYMDGSRSRLADLERLREERDVRPSLEPSQCSDAEINEVIKKNAKAATELDVERDVVPAILGRCRLPHTGNVPWTRMTSMTEGQSVAPQPDLYYGTDLDDIDRALRDAIGHLIVPSAVPNAPGLPHFILENKGPSGSPAVLKRQLVHSAAAAARSEFTLENFGKPEPEYDNKALVHAWSFSSSTGDLTHYAMHVSKPKAGSSQLGYYATQVKKYLITDGPDEFRKGVSAFRAWRDDSNAKSQERLANAHAHVRQHGQQASHPVTASDPAENEIYAAAPLPGEHQEDVNIVHPISRNYGSTTSPSPPPGVDVDTDEPTREYYIWLDQQLQADCAASFSQDTSFPSVTVTTSMTSVSTCVTALPCDGADDDDKHSRPKRHRRPPKRFGE